LSPEKIKKLLEIKEIDWYTTGKSKKHDLSNKLHHPINPRR
jgi:hypothetical protein